VIPDQRLVFVVSLLLGGLLALAALVRYAARAVHPH
jgi:hypothetical protein